jgi:hypothetical protein
MLQRQRGGDAAHLHQPPDPFGQQAQDAIREGFNLLDLMVQGCALQPQQGGEHAHRGCLTCRRLGTGGGNIESKTSSACVPGIAHFMIWRHPGCCLLLPFLF